MPTLLGLGAWVSTLAGLAILMGSLRAPVFASLLFGAVVALRRVFLMARARVRRLRTWPRPGEVEYPAGPRRVPLLETGLAGPE